MICEESIRYTISKGNHSFTIDTNTLKAFIAVLWLVVMWTCQDDQCIRNAMKTPITQQYHHYYHETDLMK